MKKPSLAKAIAQVDQALRDGEEINCPCCGKRIHADRRPIHAEVALFLVKLVRLFEEEEAWYHTTEVIPRKQAKGKSSTDAAYLDRWNPPLLEKHPESSGYYAPTQAGIDFVNGKTKAREAAYIFDGRVVRWDSRMITIEEAVGKKFDIEEVLGRSPKRK